MDISELIAIGYEKAGGREELAAIIGITETNLSAAKKKRRPLPGEACVLLGNYIGVPWPEILKATKIATAKNDEDVNLWKNAAMLASFVIVTNILTPSPAEAAPLSKNDGGIMYIM